ncbi:MAG TPA: carbon-nitrogen hydrolase family protein [Clostridia bacterium]|nr:carbon-nitrogen hydrolase family protein [Clostridia bacterium]
MNVRVGGVQLGPFTGDYHGDIKRAVRYINEAEGLEIDIICFPELCITPYFPKSNGDGVQDWFLSLDDHRLKTVIDSTQDKHVTVIFPFAENGVEGRFNSALVINKGTVVGKYRKVHLPFLKKGSKFSNYEAELFQTGNLGFPVFNVSNIPIGIQICFDRHFPEGFRVLSLKGSKIIFLPSNSAAFDSDPLRLEMWERLVSVRAYENGVYLVAVNKAGWEDGWDFMGNSMIVNPQGKVVKRLNMEEGIFFADIPRDELQQPGRFLTKRTPGNYEEIVQSI